MIHKLTRQLAVRRSSRNIARLYSGEMSAREQDRLGNWRRDSGEYQRRFVDTMQLLSDMEVLSDDPELLALVKARRQTPLDTRPKSPTLWPKLAVAAGLTGALALGFYSWDPTLQQSADIDRYVTRIGEQKSVDLADGSVITLNTATELLVEITDDTRQLTLKRGEAYFDVASDTRPFIVELGNRAVSVLGTEFNIYRSPERFTLAVTEGVVSIHQAHEQPDLGAPLLDPPEGEILRLKSAGQRRVTAGLVAEFDVEKQQLSAYRNQHIERLHGWRKGVIRFDAVPLSVVVQELNRYSAKKILIEDAAIMNLELYATVRINRINMALTVLENALPVKAVQHFDRIVLKKSD